MGNAKADKEAKAKVKAQKDAEKKAKAKAKAAEKKTKADSKEAEKKAKAKAEEVKVKKDAEAANNKPLDTKDPKHPQAPHKNFAKEYKTKGGKMVKVLAFKNSNLINGSQLTIGQECEITEAEYKHIQADKRDIKFCELVK